MRGFLNIDKPAGHSSFDVVRAVRRAAGIRRVGHAGTLDPAATGVLPVALGEATRLVEEVLGAPKRYRALHRAREPRPTPTTARVRSSPGVMPLPSPANRWSGGSAPFRGEQWQRPPAYSGGEAGRASPPTGRPARERPLDLEEREVVTYAVDLLGFERATGEAPLVTLEVEVRARATICAPSHATSGVPSGAAHTSARSNASASGPFRAEESVPLDVAVERLRADDVETLVHAPDAVLTSWPALIVADEAVAELRVGRDIRTRRHWPQPRRAPRGRKGAMLRTRRTPRRSARGDGDPRRLAPLPRAAGQPARGEGAAAASGGGASG